jgi:alkaline phosphatase D
MNQMSRRNWVVVVLFSVILSACAGPLSKPSEESKAEKTSTAPTVAAQGNVPAKFLYKPPRSNDLIPRGLDFANAPSLIAFGSCAHQDFPQPIWEVISKTNPDLFLFMGDNVYASKPETKPISAQYEKLNQIKEFRSFREKIPFLATWDDHDYGLNNGGAENPEKEEAKKVFLNQWAYVRDSLKLNQGGIYYAKTLGGVRKKSPIVQVILLDTRWFRSPLKPAMEAQATGKNYLPNEDKGVTILGEEQWQWLERQLLKPANLRLVVSSIQFIPENQGFEKWANFPKEKERFISLLKRTHAKNLFILSGDRHQGSISKMDINGWGPLFEVTSSSLNRPKVYEESDPTYLGPLVKTENFGLALIDWQKKRIRFELRNLQGETLNKIETSIK